MDGTLPGGADEARLFDRASVDLLASIENLLSRQVARRDGWAQVVVPTFDAIGAPTWARDLLLSLADARVRLVELARRLLADRPDVLPGFKGEAGRAIGFAHRTALEVVRRCQVDGEAIDGLLEPLHAFRELGQEAVKGVLLGNLEPLGAFSGKATLDAVATLHALEDLIVKRERLPSVMDTSEGPERRSALMLWNQPDPTLSIGFVTGPRIARSPELLLGGGCAAREDLARDEITAERLGLTRDTDRATLKALLDEAPGVWVSGRLVDSRAVGRLRALLRPIGWDVPRGRTAGAKGYRLERAAANSPA